MVPFPVWRTLATSLVHAPASWRAAPRLHCSRRSLPAALYHCCLRPASRAHLRWRVNGLQQARALLSPALPDSGRDGGHAAEQTGWALRRAGATVFLAEEQCGAARRRKRLAPAADFCLSSLIFLAARLPATAKVEDGGFSADAERPYDRTGAANLLDET